MKRRDLYTPILYITYITYISYIEKKYERIQSQLNIIQSWYKMIQPRMQLCDRSVYSSKHSNTSKLKRNAIILLIKITLWVMFISDKTNIGDTSRYEISNFKLRTTTNLITGRLCGPKFCWYCGTYSGGLISKYLSINVKY